MDENNPIITLADLKTAFDQAVEERKIIDAKLAEIKKQIQEQRKKAEDLDKKTDIYVTENEVTPAPAIPDVAVPSFDSLSEGIKRLLSVVVKYIIPIIIILAFIVAYAQKHVSSPKTSMKTATTLYIPSEEATQTYLELTS